MLTSHIWYRFVEYVATVQQLIGGDSRAGVSLHCRNVAFSEDWTVLGPFQIGTREAIWGADPLEYYGGFRVLEYNQIATFKSSLAANGTVAWSKTTAKLSSADAEHTSAKLSVAFPEIDWRMLQDAYGWAALQWQGWVRGEIRVRSPGVRTLALHTEQVLEFWIDGEHHYGGDFYGYGRVPLTLHLAPGVHTIDIRLVRDVRAMGGVGQPTIDINLGLETSAESLRAVQLRPGDRYSEVLISDLVDGEIGRLASPLASVMLRNDAEFDSYVLEINPTDNGCEVELVMDDPIKIIPGQTRPVAFRLTCVAQSFSCGAIGLEINYRLEGEDSHRVLETATLPIARNLRDTQKLTFMHPAGVVSYAVLHAPPSDAGCAPNASLPVLLQLHGAGLQADSEQVRHALDPVLDLCAWVLFPTGGSPWSGDDWHQWGFADVEAAVSAISDWIEQVGWKGPGVNVDCWLVSGHSNGGQGTWYALTHSPDKIIAAAPVAGYSSIQNYVPYHFWRVADPGKTAVVRSALNSYRHELLLENAKGIPILQQHGSCDDNVPPYHSRLLSQLVQQAGAESTYVEMPGKGHWYDGVMTSEPLVEFYRRHINKRSNMDRLLELHDFTIVSSNQGDMGSKNGVEILQLAVPGQLGRLHISIDPITFTCVVQISNVDWFSMPAIFSGCNLLTIDGQGVSVMSNDGQSHSWMKRDGMWKGVNNAIPAAPQRHGQQLGALDAILRTHGAFAIVHHSGNAKKVALQISRNLCQYYGADTEITADYEEARGQPTVNMISVAIGSDVPNNLPGAQHPIQVFKDRIEVTDLDGELRSYVARDGLAAIFLRPIRADRLELVVWGVDKESLEIAARLVPMLPGTGQPDFVIADRSMLWKGVDGTLALGYFDSFWKVSRNSYFT